MFWQLARHSLSDLQRTVGLIRLICLINNVPEAAVGEILPYATSTEVLEKRRSTALHTSWRYILFYSWNVSDTCPWFVIIFWPQKYILCWLISPDGQYIYSMTTLCNVIYHYISSLFTTTWYERVIYRSMSFVCLLIGLITYWRKKDLRLALYVV